MDYAMNEQQLLDQVRPQHFATVRGDSDQHVEGQSIFIAEANSYSIRHDLSHCCGTKEMMQPQREMIGATGSENSPYLLHGL